MFQLKTLKTEGKANTIITFSLKLKAPLEQKTTMDNKKFINVTKGQGGGCNVWKQTQSSANN